MKPLLLILTVLIAISCTVNNPDQFDLKNIQQKNPEICTIQNDVLKITPTSKNQSLTVWEGNNPGRFDGENYNIGFMDICNQPYRELVDAAKLTHQKMYEVASGNKKPFGEIIEKIPPIHY